MAFHLADNKANLHHKGQNKTKERKRKTWFELWPKKFPVQQWNVSSSEKPIIINLCQTIYLTAQPPGLFT